LQGFLVLLSNPKILLFLGAFVPQFVDESGSVVAQMMLLSATLLTIGVTIDGSYALLAGSAGSYLNEKRTRLINRAGGSFLIAGGVWMALVRR
jgi:threonine/homoserine/homoserine lactone efflux protein